MDAGRIERIRKEASEERRTLRGGDVLSSHFAGLCLELLEHVAEQGAQVSRLQAQLQSASYREVLNLRARAARLTPLEFLLAKGGDPMAQMAEAIRELSDKLNRSERAGSKVPMAPHVFAQMVNEVRDLAFDFGTSEQFRCRMSDLLGKYINVEHNSKGVPEQTEAPAVVVPEPSIDDDEAILKSLPAGYEFDDGPIPLIHAAVAWARERSRPIPADRVLGDGMVQVSQEERLALGECSMVLRAYSKTHGIGVAAIERLDALRANQGGADCV